MASNQNESALNVSTNQTTEELLASLTGPVLKNDLALTVFTPVEQMPSGQPWDLIKAAYRQPSRSTKIMAMLMNGCVSSRRQDFFLSRAWLLRYMDADPNIPEDQKLKSISGASQTKLMDQLLAVMTSHEAFLKTLTPPSKKGSNERRAGIYEISNSSFTKFLPWFHD